MSAKRPCINKKIYIYSDGTHTNTELPFEQESSKIRYIVGSARTCGQLRLMVALSASNAYTAAEGQQALIREMHPLPGTSDTALRISMLNSQFGRTNLQHRFCAWSCVLHASPWLRLRHRLTHQLPPKQAFGAECGAVRDSESR